MTGNLVAWRLICENNCGYGKKNPSTDVFSELCSIFVETILCWGSVV